MDEHEHEFTTIEVMTMSLREPEISYSFCEICGVPARVLPDYLIQEEP